VSAGDLKDDLKLVGVGAIVGHIYVNVCWNKCEFWIGEMLQNIKEKRQKIYRSIWSWYFVAEKNIIKSCLACL